MSREPSERSIVTWLPNWPVITAGQDDRVPLAVVAAERVVAYSPAARSAGVRRGMPVRVARGRAVGLCVVERDVAAETRQFEPVARLLEQEVAPRLAVIRPGLVVLPARGPARYWGGENPVAEHITSLVREAGYVSRSGAADTVFAAALAARRRCRVPTGMTARFLAPYPVRVLGRARLTDLLERLGISTVGAFAALPGAAVLERFGASGAAAQRTARGQQERPPAGRIGAGDHVVGVRFDPAEERLEPVAFAAKTLAARLHGRLRGAGVVPAQVELRVELADGRQLARRWQHQLPAVGSGGG